MKIPPSLAVITATGQHIVMSLWQLCLPIILSILLGFILDKSRAGEGSNKPNWLIRLLPAFIMVALLLTKGVSMSTWKGFILSCILLKASVSDIQTRQVPDALSIMILITALIDTAPYQLPGMIFSALAVGIPQLIVAASRPGTYGGADIKVTASAAFLLGAWKGFFAVIVGLIAAIIIPAAHRYIKKESLKEGIPMIPYLTFGILLAYFI